MNKKKIKYLIVGGIAANLFGVRRFTRDLDLMIEISKETLSKFMALMHSLGYETNVDIKEALGLSAISFVHKKDEYKQVDIFIKNPIDFSSAFKRKKLIKAGRLNCLCASKSDLIKMKEISGRDRDWVDIGALKRMK